MYLEGRSSRGVEVEATRSHVQLPGTHLEGPTQVEVAVVGADGKAVAEVVACTTIAVDDGREGERDGGKGKGTEGGRGGGKGKGREGGRGGGKGKGREGGREGMGKGGRETTRLTCVGWEAGPGPSSCTLVCGCNCLYDFPKTPTNEGLSASI